MSEFIFGDCMEGMKRFPDGYFDLAIVDPPYGIENGNRATSSLRKYGGLDFANDKKPEKKYFDELFRVSKNQIIWGYNHLSDMLPSTKEFIFWYKHQTVDTYADGELAWTSFEKTAKCFDYPFYGFVNREEDRIHPMQKPIALYEWLLTRYAKPGYRILDTHVGSASSLIACERMGFDYVGFELNPEFYERAQKRMEQHRNQITLMEAF